MITPKRPSGFNEFLPKDQMAFNAMMSVIKLVYEQHGYAPIETPALELAEVLLAKEGGESAKQSYRFTKGDTDLAMRFDLTVPLARYVAEHYHELSFPFRRYQIQEVWRGEKAQAGRYRQFYQCDIDIIGSNSLLAEADILLTSNDVIKELGLKDAIIKISHRGVLNAWLESKKLKHLNAEVLRSVDKLEKQGDKKVTEELLKIGLNKNDIQQILGLVKISGKADEVIKKLSLIKIDNEEFKKALNDIKELDTYLKAAGLNNKNYIFDLKIIRGLDYYTGIVFETVLTKNPELGSICGGGRYDNLVGFYHKEKLSGIGASIGLSRLFNAIKDRLNNDQSTPAQVLIMPLDKSVVPYCLEVAKKINQAKLNVFVYPGLDKMSKQLNYANKIKIPLVILIGENELKKKAVTIKNMKTGKQSSTSLAKAAATIRKML